MAPNKFCRLCTKYHTSTINIFGERGKNHLLPFKVLNYARIFISETDPLSKFVCILCIGKLHFVENFQADCQDAQTFFRKRLAKHRTGDHDEQTEIEVEDGNKSKRNTHACNIENDASDVNNSTCKKVTVSTFSDEVAKDIGIEMEVDEEDDDLPAENTDSGDGENITLPDHSESIGVNKIDDSLVDTLCSEVDIDKKITITDDCDLIERKALNETHRENYGVFEKDSNSYNIENTVKSTCNDSREMSQSINVDTKDILKTSDVRVMPVSSILPIINITPLSLDEKDSNNGVTIKSCIDSVMETKDKESNNVLEKESNHCINERTITVGLNEPDEMSDSDDDDDCYGSDINDTEIAGPSSIGQSGTVDPRKVYVDVEDNDMDSLYLRLSDHEKIKDSLPVYLSCIKNIIDKKCSVMPYFTKMYSLTHEISFGFKCFVCKHVMPAKSYSYVIKHLLFHLDLHCFYCKLFFRVVPCMKTHYRNFHFNRTASGNFKCHHCSETCDEFDNYTKHLRSHYHEYCALCEFKTMSPAKLDEHLSEKHKNEKEHCSNCIIFHHDNYMKHFKETEKFGFICESCDMVFHNEDYLRVHYKIYGTDHGIKDKSNDIATVSALPRNISTSSSKKLKLNHKFYEQFDEKLKFFRDVFEKKITLKQINSKEVIINENKDKVLHCPLCLTRFVKTENNFLRHVTTHILLCCFKCKRFCRDRRHFGRHVTKCNVTDFKCLLCKNKTFTGLNQYTAHVKHHMDGKICYYCNEYITLLNKKNHIYTMHKDLIKSKLCEICGKKVRPDNISFHMGTHHPKHINSKSKLCPHCGEMFQFKHLHSCFKKKESEKEKFICDYCSKVFSKKDSLITHIQVHMNEKSFSCDFCDKKFNRKTSLTKHKSDMHSHQRRYLCTVGDCTSSFTFKSALKTHLKTVHSMNN